MGYKLIKTIKKEIDGLTQTYNKLIFAFNDHQYLTLSHGDILRAAFLSRNQIFFHRLKYYLLHFTIIELFKLLSEKEKYNIRKFIESALNKQDNKAYNVRLIEI